MLVRDDLRSGRLVQLLDVVLPLERAYCFVCPARKRQLHGVAAFREWLTAEMAADAHRF
jgi:DNA-binding transcriptional LysR family regulator